jgi:hypothetical protein
LNGQEFLTSRHVESAVQREDVRRKRVNGVK